MESISISDILQAIFTLAFTVVMFNVRDFKSVMTKMGTNIEKLNINIATLLANDINKDKRLNNLDEEVHDIKEESSRLRSGMHEIRNEVTKISTKIELKDK